MVKTSLNEWIGNPGLRAVGDDEVAVVTEVLIKKTLYRGAGLSAPKYVAQCEQYLCELYDKKYCLLLNSGTSALIAAFHSINLQPGDEVILPGYGWLTDVMAILFYEAVPVFCPILPGLILSHDAIVDCITHKTKAIVPIHACGNQCDLQKIKDVVSHNQSIFIIEDASQCFTGSSVSPSHCVDMTILSFQAFKLVTAGEGGALLTDNLELYTKALQFHDAGLQRFSSHLSIVDAHEIPTGIGLNLRMNEVSAGILHCQLKKYQKITSDLKISRTNLLKSLSPAFEAGIMRFISTERINYAYLTLQGNSKDIIENFVEKLQQLGYPFKIAGKLPYHALPGWLRYLEYNHYHYHAINIEQTNAILDTTIIIEVNWQLDDKSINQFSDTISGLVSHFI